MSWEKVLYRRQSFPDNYVEPSKFLKDLERNCEVVEKILPSGLGGFMLIALITTVFLFLVKFCKQLHIIIIIINKINIWLVNRSKYSAQELVCLSVVIVYPFTV